MTHSLHELKTSLGVVDVVGVGEGVGVGVALGEGVGVGEAVGVGVAATALLVPGQVCDKRIPELMELVSAQVPD